MGYLLALSCALILYGTLFPFSFQPGLHEESVFALLRASANDHVSRGDVLANVILFFPFGFFAMQSVFPRVPRFLRLFFVVVAGAAFSFSIESVQSCLPGRVTSIYDIATNTAGTLLGAAFGWKDWHGKISWFKSGKRQFAIFPAFLLCAWICSQLFPFVPTLDFQNVKNALKPLIFGNFLPLNALKSFMITMVVCKLVQTLTSPGRVRTVLTFLPLGVIMAMPFILGGAISQAKILGTLLGLAAWWFVLGRIRRNTAILALLLTAQTVIHGLSPFVFNSEPGHFSFIPFYGFLNGSMLINLLSFFEKIFLYGALLWLIVKTGLHLRLSIIFCVVLLTGIEVMQLFQTGHVSEITDPMLAVILGVFMYFLDLRKKQLVTMIVD